MSKHHIHKLRTLLLLTLLAALPALLTGSAHAQSTGNFTGTVTDSSGAAIPGASVVIQSPETGFTRSVVTNSSGAYAIPDVPIGSYAITISKSGFSTQKRPAQQLLTGQTVGLDAALSIGSTVENIEVSSDTQQMQTATSEVSTTVEKEQIQDLPLNGRNPLTLTQLTPGATITNVGTESGQQDNQGLTVNGLRATENNYLLDNAIYVDRFFDSVPILPNPDALQEFTIQATNFSAQYAGAGALVQLSTRSGTNSLHGSAFEFFRNTVLDAYGYFLVKNPTTQQVTRAPYKLNQFGGTVGGPVVIPHVYNGRDKTFFFFSAEDKQQRAAANSSSFTMPTPANATGDFSNLCYGGFNGAGICTGGTQLYDPVQRTPIANNKITNPDKLSTNVYNQFLTGVQGVPNTVTNGIVQNYIYRFFPNVNQDSTQYLIHMDHQVSSKNHLSGRYFYNQDNFQRAFAAPTGFYAENLFRNQTLTIADTHTFSPTLTLSLYATGARFARTQIPVAPGLVTLQQLGYNTPLGTTAITIFPGIRSNISGYVNIFSGGALKQDSTEFEYKGELVKLLGHNTITAGGILERSRVDAVDYSYVPGDNTFDGGRTSAPAGTTCPTGAKCAGNAYADFYTGYETTFYQDNGRKFYLREWRPSLFVQDDYKLSPTLTINAGVRWDPWIPPIDLNNTLVGFVPGFKSTIAPNAPTGLQFNGDPGSVPAVFHNAYTNFAPRVGFAYNVSGTGQTVIRGAFGIFFGFPEGLLYQRTDALQPVDLYLNIAGPPQWDNVYAGFPGGDPFPRGHISPSQFATYQFITPVSGGVLDPGSKSAYTENYNFTVEQQLPFGVSMSIGYVGNHAVHVMGSRQFNPAVCPIAGNTTGQGAICSSGNNSVGCTGCTISNENSRRLYGGLGSVELAQSYEYANFNSLQVVAQRRVAKNLTIFANYVWSKAMDNVSSAAEGNTGPHNPFNLSSGYGPADFNQTNRFNASLNYLLPRFHGNSFAGVFLNGWQANAIIQSQSGLPFTLTSGTDRSLSGIGNDYADYAVPAVSPAKLSTAGHLTWFNPLAYTPAAAGTFGNVARNSLVGPRYNDFDASLFKDLFEHNSIHAQFHAEAFNLFNHTNLGNPVAAANNASFGNITTTTAPYIPRVFQFALKILF